MTKQRMCLHSTEQKIYPSPEKFYTTTGHNGYDIFHVWYGYVYFLDFPVFACNQQFRPEDCGLLNSWKYNIFGCGILILQRPSCSLYQAYSVHGICWALAGYQGVFVLLNKYWYFLFLAIWLFEAIQGIFWCILVYLRLFLNIFGGICWYLELFFAIDWYLGTYCWYFGYVIYIFCGYFAVFCEYLGIW